MLDSLKDAAERIAFPLILTAATGTLSYLFLDKYANGKGMNNADFLHGTAAYLEGYDGKAQNIAHHAFETVELVRGNNPHIEELSELSRDLEERLSNGQAMDTKELSEKMYSIVRKHDVGAEEIIWGVGMGLFALIGLGGTMYGIREIIRDHRIFKELHERAVRLELAELRARREQERAQEQQDDTASQ